MALDGWWRRLGPAFGAFWRTLAGDCSTGRDDDGEGQVPAQALAASEARLRATWNLLTDALESSSDAFSLYDADDRLVAFNSRYKEYYHTIADIVRPGISFAELTRLSAERGQYADIPPERIEEWLRERTAHHRRAEGVFEQKLADGRCLEIVERPTSDGGRVAIRRDVTARKHIENALRRELAFEQTLIDALPFPVFFKDRDGRFLGCNTKFAGALGHSIDEIVGHTLFDLLPEELAEDYTGTDAALLAQPGVQMREITMRWSDGSIRRLNVVKGTFSDTHGQVAGYIGSLIDITQQKRTEEQLVQAAKLATLGQIASEVAHELNQPLSIIMLSAEGCLHGLEGDRTRLEAKLTTITAQVKRMAEIVGHLRSFSRLESGDKKDFVPAPVVRSAIGLLSPHFQLDGITLDIDVDQDCPNVLGQPNQYEQVLLNLLSNARDAVRGQKGGGRVAVRLWTESGWVHLSVSDNGGGIPQQLWPQVFEPFYTTKADGTGTGLGLSISANIVAGMNGRIEGCNQDGGACFRVSVPAHGAASCLAVADTTAPPPPPPAAAPRGRVLVVDDEELAAQCIAEYLDARGFQVAIANNFDNALMQARQGPPDLLVTDLRLPGQSGMALMERLRRDIRDLPVVLMTGGPLPTGNFGPQTALLGKPLALSELIGQVERLLNERTPA